MPFLRRIFMFTILFAAAAAGSIRAVDDKPPAQVELSAEEVKAIGLIRADSLKGHLSFIASDLLEGRDTPSRGLDLAAEYIAAQFRRAGLEPVGDDGYFQTANWSIEEPDKSAFSLSIHDGQSLLSIDPSKISSTLRDKTDLEAIPIFKVLANDADALKALTPEQIKGNAVVTELPDVRRVEQSKRQAVFRSLQAFRDRMSSLGAALVIGVDRDENAAVGLSPGRLIDPESRGGLRMPAANPPRIQIHDPRIVALYDRLSPGASEAKLSLHQAAPVERPVKVKNVVGLLRGSDPALKETYVLVTAHYDHVGISTPTNGDKIYNGANDDGSGTVSVVEIASALGSLEKKPARSIVFMTFFGEEHGLLGSRYYGRRPIFPIEKTVADVNLEQVGRTDSSEGDQSNAGSMTGFDFSDVGPIFQAAGEKEGVRVFKHPTNSDAFFGRSDNQALADLGVPAHTLCVAYVYPDYHQAGDHWEKVNFENMAKVDKMVARALLMIAESPVEPKWNEANAKAARYLKAWKQRRGQ